MTDIVQKIREAVEKLKSQLLRGACSSQVAMETRCKEEAYNEVLAILDTMQEEPVCIWHDKGEEPDRDRQVMIYLSGFCYVVFYHRKDKRFYSSGNSKFYLCEVDKWAYVDDLLNLSNVQRTVKNRKEPVSEELGKASMEFAKYFGEWDYAIPCFQAGAKWQKEQDQETIEVAEDHAMLAGRMQMKEEMMAKAIDGDITFDYYGNDDKIYGCIAHDSFCLEDFGLKDTDKVKVIVIRRTDV